MQSVGFQINNDPKKRTFITRGFKAFNNEDYKNALMFFGEALFLDKDDLNAKIGLLLSDLALDFPKQAHTFYDTYQTLLSTQPRSAKEKIQRQILDLLNAFDIDLNKKLSIIQDEDNTKVDSINGILYADFKKIIQKTDFKETFQNLMFSTKIVFTNKNDFIDFLDLLTENGLYDMSLSYIENLNQIAIYDPKLNKILQKVIEKKNENTKTD